jgi:hypothetical protein
MGPEHNGGEILYITMFFAAYLCDLRVPCGRNRFLNQKALFTEDRKDHEDGRKILGAPLKHDF